MNRLFTTASVFTIALVASSLALISLSGLAQTKFPVTVKHDAGETVVATEPQRVIALHPTRTSASVPTNSAI